MEEIWRDIKGYEGLYEVSNYGHFYNVKDNRTKKTCKVGAKQYHYVYLWKNNVSTPFRVNRLVYETFVGPIPKGMEVNHIDEDKNNNAIWNLNLMTAKENANWGTRNERMIDTRNIKQSSNAEKPVLQYRLNGFFVCEYKSISEASRQTGIPQSHISRVCRGKRKTAGGFKWKYKDVA